MTHVRNPPQTPRRQPRGNRHGHRRRHALHGPRSRYDHRPPRECEKRLRESVATEDQHTALLMAQGIEESGIVPGLHEYIASAVRAMASIRDQALASGAWRPTALYYYELDAIREAVDLHKYQLLQVTCGELHAIARKLIARTQSTGGAVTRTSMQDLGLLAA